VLPSGVQRKRLATFIATPVVLLLAGGGIFFIGNKYAVDHLSVARVTSEQLAQAMEGDYFYSNYRDRTLLLSGTVSAIDQSHGVPELVFKGAAGYQVRCTLDKSTSVPIVGSSITVVTEGARAERLSAGVLLRDCVIP